MKVLSAEGENGVREAGAGETWLLAVATAKLLSYDNKPVLQSEPWLAQCMAASSELVAKAHDFAYFSAGFAAL